MHAAFPAGVVDDVNYGGSIRAFLFLLNNDCCTSLDKSLRFLSDLTDGKLKLSKGMASKLGREFASNVIRQIIWSRFRQFIWMCSQVQIAYWSG